uniref:Uncharacterized protein n=1 Tax=Knipowitschia caucasica TaxID=637954 RepID=A0AAV2LTE6_KNICA
MPPRGPSAGRRPPGVRAGLTGCVKPEKEGVELGARGCCVRSTEPDNALPSGAILEQLGVYGGLIAVSRKSCLPSLVFCVFPLPLVTVWLCSESFSYCFSSDV